MSAKKFTANPSVYAAVVQSAAVPADPTPEEQQARVNFRCSATQKEYLQEIAWQNRTDITKYLVALIDADMQKHPNWRDGLDALNYSK